MQNQSPFESVKTAFERIYVEKPAFVVRAPGRVNLVGEHTDYNDGFVFPMAIDSGVWIALRPRVDRKVVIQSLDFNETIAFDLLQLEAEKPVKPAEYMKGVAWALTQAGYDLTGFEGCMQGNVPIGAGLSSSAALEVATARAFAVVSGFSWDAARMAQLSQKAENEWVGMNCGIMDQMISAAGKAGSALLIDCRTLEFEVAPIPSNAVVVVLDTSTRRGLVDSAYNERRAQCEAAARYFDVKALRDVSVERLLAEGSGLDQVTFRRARHIVTENARTLEAKQAMQADDAAWLGRLMKASHASLRDDFEVSSPALDTMVDLANDFRGCFGARMTGAGFGGCAVALVDRNKAERFVNYISPAYRHATGNSPQIYVTQPAEGASVVEERG
ncbi:galactokinase [Ornatilinea apprima]|uniref:Galactokinase n=1 Tax=Ornatilinea apprima TaxID=1134406 RepID=A0A0P6XR08_9CHLR|nr:galactokinase [Ornatilinea apprima]KPL71993.1 galactokinase [Ornatilinea apprima]